MVWKKLPPKFRKNCKRWGHLLAFAVLFFVSVHHLHMAMLEALHTKLTPAELAQAREAARPDGGGDVDAVLTSSYISLKVGLRGFFRYFRNNRLSAFIVLVTLCEIGWRSWRGFRYCRRWYRRRKARRSRDQGTPSPLS